jgi:hypothetical protein
MKSLSNVALYKLLTGQLNELTPKLILSRPFADLANYIVFQQLQKQVYQEDIENFCRSYAPSYSDDFGPFCLPLFRSPRSAESAEIPEAVLHLAMEMFAIVCTIGRANLDHAIPILIDILRLSSEQYLECQSKHGRLRIESTAKFERKYDCRVRLKIACPNPFLPD